MEIKLDHLLPAARDMALLSAEQRVASNSKFGLYHLCKPYVWLFICTING